MNQYFYECQIRPLIIRGKLYCGFPLGTELVLVNKPVPLSWMSSKRAFIRFCEGNERFEDYKISGLFRNMYYARNRMQTSPG